MNRRLGARLLAAWLLVLSAGCRSTSPGFGLSGAATAASSGQESDPLDLPTPLDPAIHFGRLPNGLTYYVLRHPVPERRAALWLAVKAGSVLEDDDQLGAAHFVEHMVFRGTRRFPGKAIADYIESSGMSMGPDFNGYTAYDETVYQMTVPTADPSVTLKGIDILRDIAGDVTFSEEDVEKERHVLLEEWRRNDVATMRSNHLVMPVVLRGSRYADRHPAGTLESIGSVRAAALSRFYRDWYRPDRMAVIAVGDFVDSDLESAIRTRFADLSPATKARDPGPLAVPRDPGLVVAVNTDVEATSTSVTVYQKLDRRHDETKRDYRRQLDERLFVRMMNSRFADLRDRVESPLVESSIEQQGLTQSTDALTWSAAAKEARLADAVTLLTREIARAERGFQPTELARQSGALLVSAEANARENDKLPAEHFVEKIVRHFLLHEQMPGYATELRWARELLSQITVDEVRAAARVWNHDQGRIVVISGPRNSNLPRADSFRAMIERARATSLAPWTDETFDGPLMAQKPVPGRVVQSSWDRAAEATVWQLANGVRVVVKATSFENGWIRVEGSQPGGRAMVAESDVTQARFAAEIMTESGAGELSALQISRALTGKDIELDVDISDSYQRVTAETGPQDLETLLQLLHLRMAYPSRNDVGFDLWKAKRLEAELHRLDSPDERINDAIASVLYGDHPLHRPITSDAIQRINLDRVVEIWKQRFADFNGFTFVFVGSVDLEKLKPLVETYLGSLPSRGRTAHVVDPKIRYPRATVERAVTAGPVARSWVWVGFTAPERWTIDAERDARILDKVLAMRFFDLLRQKAGMVYDMRTGVHLDREPTERHILVVLFACAPENADTLRDMVLSELAEIARNGVGREYLDKAAAQIRKAREGDLKDNQWWLAQLSDAYRHDDDFARVKDIDATLARITNDHIKATAARIVEGKPHIVVSLRPAAAAPETK